MKRIALIHNKTQVGIVETSRQPYVGARFDDVAPGMVYRLAGWIDDVTAKVEVVPSEISPGPTSSTKKLV